jgi:hypothetical protein
MAGVKVTDLPVLGAAASDDVLYIVDTSDNLSKQIEVSNLTASLGASSGRFLSTISSEIGFDTILIQEGVWIRIGDIIQFGCKITFSLDPTGVGADQNGQFEINFPEKVTSFEDNWHSFGITIGETVPNTFVKNIFYTGNKATIDITSIGTGASAYAGYVYVTAIYQI